MVIFIYKNYYFIDLKKAKVVLKFLFLFFIAKNERFLIKLNLFFNNKFLNYNNYISIFIKIIYEYNFYLVNDL